MGKRYHRSRRTKKSKKPKGITWMQFAEKAWSGVKALKGLINSEQIYRDVTSATTADINGAIVALSPIAQGDDEGSRTGNSILAKTLEMSLYVQADTTPTVTVFRFIIFQDRMNTSTVPTPAQVLAVTGTSAVVVSPILATAHKNQRFKIIADVSHSFTGGAGHLAWKYDNVFKINNHIQFTGSATTDEGKNMLYMLVCSSQSAANLPNYNSYFRLKYYDN